MSNSTLRKGEVDFSNHLHEWDGFGVNYVEEAQYRNYNRIKKDPQEYGGFSLLSQEEREEILEMIFGEEGLKPAMTKMFLDSFHQEEENQNSPGPNNLELSNYDHETTTKWMRYFNREGLKRTRARGDDLQILVTLYGPPGWMTKQGFTRGRDLDPEYREECAKYMISWAKFLREEEGLPVRYISVHNEGEDWRRWPEDGSGPGEPNHDYNMYWPPAQVVDFLRFSREILDAQGMEDVSFTPGETSNWFRFSEWGYAKAIADDEQALENMGLITSHGFFNGELGGWYGDWRSRGIDKLREKKPSLHACVTSTSWSEMDAFFVKEIRNNIYSAKVNSIIPWAAVQRRGRWIGGDPNPGTAFVVQKGRGYQVQPGYYYFKQVSRAGQAGTSVAEVAVNDSEMSLIAFAGDGSGNPDSFVLINTGKEKKEIELHLEGTESDSFKAYRTSPEERYDPAGTFTATDGRMTYAAPAGSVTTFFGDDAE